jgi:hypothetical protein
MDIDDPMGLPQAAYRRAFDRIAQGVTVLADALCGAKPSAPVRGEIPWRQ